MSDELSSVEAAAQLRITVREVQRLCRTGALAGRKVHAHWAINRASVLAYAAARSGKHKPE